MNRIGELVRHKMERYPYSLVWVLDLVKDGDEQYWKENFRAANGKAQH